MAKSTVVSLGGHFENFVANQVESGRYCSASDVVLDALRLLEERDRQLAWLRDQISEAETQLREGHVHEVNDRFWKELNLEVDEKVKGGDSPNSHAFR